MVGLALWLSEMVATAQQASSPAVQLDINHHKSLPAVQPLIGRQGLSWSLIDCEPRDLPHHWPPAQRLASGPWLLAGCELLELLELWSWWRLEK